MADWVMLLLILEGIPFLAFVYYLEHKKRLHLLERGIVEDDPMDVRMERRLISGLFLSLAGSSVIVSPNFARSMGLELSLTIELFLISIVILCGGLAMLIGYGITKGRPIYSSSSDRITELK